jgi:hypothetical protein
MIFRNYAVMVSIGNKEVSLEIIGTDRHDALTTCKQYLRGINENTKPLHSRIGRDPKEGHDIADYLLSQN